MIRFRVDRGRIAGVDDTLFGTLIIAFAGEAGFFLRGALIINRRFVSACKEPLARLQHHETNVLCQSLRVPALEQGADIDP